MKQILILEPISIPEPTLIREPIPEPILIREAIPENDSGPTVRNRFQKTSELAGIDSDENFIFAITLLEARQIHSGSRYKFYGRVQSKVFNLRHELVCMPFEENSLLGKTRAKKKIKRKMN